MSFTTILGLGQTALELGLMSSLTVLALFLSYTMLNVCDLSTDGCFTLGAAVGAVGALSIFVAFPAQIAWLAFRLMLAAVMTRIALPWAGLRRWAGSVLCLLAVSFLFSGEHLAEPPETSIRIERT